MMTSAAETPSSGWSSVGIPRPLSETETDPSPFNVTRTRSQWPARACVYGVVHDLIDHVVEA